MWAFDTSAPADWCIVINAKELTHILLHHLNNNLLPNLLLLWKSIPYPPNLLSKRLATAKLPSCTGGFSSVQFMSKYNKGGKKKTYPLNCRHLREILWLQGSFVSQINVKACPLGIIADQIQVFVYCQGVSAVCFQHSHPCANNLRLSLISLARKATKRSGHPTLRLLAREKRDTSHHVLEKIGTKLFSQRLLPLLLLLCSPSHQQQPASDSQPHLLLLLDAQWAASWIKEESVTWFSNSSLWVQD